MRANEKRIIEGLVVSVLLSAVLIIAINVIFSIGQRFSDLIGSILGSSLIILASMALSTYLMVKFVKSSYFLELYTSKLLTGNQIVYGVISLVIFVYAYKINFSIVSPTVYSAFIFLAEFIGLTILIALGIELVVYMWNKLSKKHHIDLGHNFDHSLHF